jgi:outer membrane cobalamin receptor
VSVLENGLDTLDASALSPDHAVAADPLSLRRVEILRGPATLLYGSGAIGGVIQIFTRAPSGRQTSYAQLEGGSFGTGKVSAGFSGGKDDTKYTLGFGRNNSSGITAMSQTKYPSENPDLDGYRNTNFHLGVSQDISTDNRIGLRVQGSEGNLSFDGSGFGSASEAYKGVNNLQSWQIYSQNQLTEDWRSDFTYSENRDYAYSDLTNSSAPWISDYTTQSKIFHWNNTLSVGDFTLNAGGVINCFSEVQGLTAEWAHNKAEEIYTTIFNIVKRSKDENIPTYQIANRMAEERIESIGRVKLPM